jgi:hypothetical protein
MIGGFAELPPRYDTFSHGGQVVDVMDFQIKGCLPAQQRQDLDCPPMHN